MRDAAGCIEKEGDEGIALAKEYLEDLLLIERKRTERPYGYDRKHAAVKARRISRENPARPPDPEEEELEEELGAAEDEQRVLAAELDELNAECEQAEIEGIIGTEIQTRGGRRERVYLVRFRGYSPEDDGYFTRRELADGGHGEMIRAFERENGIAAPQAAPESFRYEGEEDVLEMGNAPPPQQQQPKLKLEVEDVYLDGCRIVARVRRADGGAAEVLAEELEQDAGEKSGALIRCLIKKAMRAP